MRWRSSLAALVAIAAFVGIYGYALREPPPPKLNPHMEPIPGLFLPEENPEDSPLLLGAGEETLQAVASPSATSTAK